MTDLLYSDVEEDLRSSVRSLLAARAPVAQTLANVETGAYDPSVWRALAGEMGLAALAVPEQFGGAGASLREAAVVLEELGRGLAPLPYLSSAVVATTALVTAGAADLLAKVATGDSIAVLATPFAHSAAEAAATVAITDGRLRGRIAGVADGLAADLFLIPVEGGGLYAVEATAEGVTRTGVLSLDLTRPLADLQLDGAAAQLVAADGAPAIGAALTAGAALLASEQLGLAEWCLQTTVEYLKTRHQFGRPVGSFQALKHRLADVWVDLAQARAVARYAAVCAATNDADLAVAASVAQAYCSPVAVKAAEECVQLHGGIGFTWEHPAHLYLKRAKADALALGTADRHRQNLATLVDLAP